MVGIAAMPDNSVFGYGLVSGKPLEVPLISYYQKCQGLASTSDVFRPNDSGGTADTPPDKVSHMTV